MIVLWGCPVYSGSISTGARTIGPESDEYAAIVAQLSQLAISFDPDSSALPEAAAVVLDDLARLMIANPEMVISLHPGSSDLPSRARTGIVGRYLRSRGVSSRQVQETGFGESEVEGDAPNEVFVDIRQGTNTLVLPDRVPVLVTAAPGSQIYFVPDQYPHYVCSPKQVMWLGPTNHLGELEQSYPPRGVFAVSVKDGVARAAHHNINPRKSPYKIDLYGAGTHPACK